MRLLKPSLSAALAAVLAVSAIALSACSGYDPNVRPDDRTDAVSTVVTETKEGTADVGEEGTDYVAVGGGRDQVREVNGVSVDVGAFARRSYELCFLLGQTNFSSPTELATDSAVLFAFCHLYYEELWRMPRRGNLLCTATLDDINAQLEEFFGDAKIDATKSNYYNSGTGDCEMFAPTYFGGSIYYNVDSAELTDDGSGIGIYTTFYKDSKKSNVLGHTVLTLKVKDGEATIVSATSDIR